MNDDHLPYLKFVYSELQRTYMCDIENLIASMDNHLLCIDVVNNKAYFVRVQSPEFVDAINRNCAFYSIQQVIKTFAH